MACKYVSFDMGIKNLALCIVRAEGDAEPAITHWEMIDTLEGTRINNAKAIRIESAVQALVDAMRARSSLWEGVDEVIIEQQPVGRLPVSNTLMKTLSHVLQAFFYALGARVRFCSPKKKLGLAGVDDAAAPAKEKAAQRYARHKQAAIDETRRRVSGEWLTWFDALPKRDDAADAFLQALVMAREDAAARVKRAEKEAKEAERERKRLEKEEKKRAAAEKRRLAAEEKEAKKRAAAEKKRLAAEAKKRAREEKESAASASAKKKPKSSKGGGDAAAPDAAAGPEVGSEGRV